MKDLKKVSKLLIKSHEPDKNNILPSSSPESSVQLAKLVLRKHVIKRPFAYGTDYFRVESKFLFQYKENSAIILVFGTIIAIYMVII